MKIAIAGGSGFIGTALTKQLIEKGHHVFILTRKTNKKDSKQMTYVPWLSTNHHPKEKLEGIDAFINLAGESIAAKRWTSSQKEKLLSSRIETVSATHHILKQLKKKPQVYLNASAIGYYGFSLTKTFTEKSKPESENFLTTVAKQWEANAKRAEQLEIRTVLLRFGLVLDKKAGALPKMLLPYQLFTGGNLGSGKQWYSWIHLDDCVGLIIHALENSQIESALNVTAPNPVTMEQFGKELANVLKRPHWLSAPSFAVKLLLGEMSSLILEGQKVLPEKALASAYHFKFPTLKEALKDLLL